MEERQKYKRLYRVQFPNAQLQFVIVNRATQVHSGLEILRVMELLYMKQSKHGTGGLRMAEYINRKVLIKKIDDYFFKTDPNGQEQIGILKCRRIIRETPSTDVAPVKHGKWIHNDDWWEFICTNCRKGIGNIQEYKYCPNCGADMRGNSDE